MTKIYVICDGAKGGIHLLAPLQPEIIGAPNGMLEPDGTFVGVVYPNSGSARTELAAVDGITVLPSHLSRQQLDAHHHAAIAPIGGGAHEVNPDDTGYQAALKLHDYYQSVAPAGSRCCAVLHPDH